MSRLPIYQTQPNQTRRPSAEATLRKACGGGHGNRWGSGVGSGWEQNMRAATSSCGGNRSGLVDADTRYSDRLKDRAGRGCVSIVDCARVRSSQSARRDAYKASVARFQHNGGTR